jgi:hypothetical protein
MFYLILNSFINSIWKFRCNPPRQIAAQAAIKEKQAEKEAKKSKK